MEVYFIRHGETDGNVAKRHQHPHTKLNEYGQSQVLTIAKKLKKRHPTHLITSTHIRSVETAQIIGNECGLIPETYPAFEELKRPKFLMGQRMLSRNTISYLIRWYFGVKSASMHDGESYDDFILRLATARQYLETLPTDAKVIIISHAVFINFFLEHLNNSDRMNLFRATVRIIKILLTKNTEVIHVRYTASKTKKDKGWKVIYGKK